MHQVVILLIKGAAGGALVVSFALISEAAEPKRFAGLFSAAPAVAIAGLTVVLLDKGAHQAHQNATGMIAGSAGMCAYAACLVPLLRRRGAAGAAAMALPVWFLVAGAVATAIMLG